MKVVVISIIFVTFSRIINNFIGNSINVKINLILSVFSGCIAYLLMLKFTKILPKKPVKARKS